MSGAVTIRLAGPEAAARILAADVFDGPAQLEATARFLGEAGKADPRNILVLAEGDGKVVGFASGVVLDHPDKAPSLFITELGVNEPARRCGIGIALLQAIRAEGRRRGCTGSWVATEGDNAPARALYRTAGGRETEGITMYEWDEDGPN